VVQVKFIFQRGYIRVTTRGMVSRAQADQLLSSTAGMVPHHRMQIGLVVALRSLQKT